MSHQYHSFIRPCIMTTKPKTPLRICVRQHEGINLHLCPTIKFSLITSKIPFFFFQNRHLLFKFARICKFPKVDQYSVVAKCIGKTTEYIRRCRTRFRGFHFAPNLEQASCGFALFTKEYYDYENRRKFDWKFL